MVAIVWPSGSAKPTIIRSPAGPDRAHDRRRPEGGALLLGEILERDFTVRRERMRAAHELAEG